ncbi:secC motif containing protein [Fictibacillus macauensis ZFHKF-1]|uniref:SecC motif containing protein n=1 Tax=Fictibacillus macauensis ZFHKF-1 TaxID=1196324 RepID=I8UDH0_9BACL|nr:SEC-C metal-binding domain-containing protein [Fictibacillus macauensis]EIT84858.1 secC motif containing protein [Fictibacillus macauensis ZFHKF-1]
MNDLTFEEKVEKLEAHLERMMKEHMKLFKNIPAHSSLLEVLNAYTKADLQDIRRFHQIPGASSFNKKELSETLAEQLPSLVLQAVQRMDLDTYKQLLKIVKHNGKSSLKQFSPGQGDVLNNMGIVYGIIENEQPMYYIPQEICDALRAIDGPSLRQRLKKNQEFILCLQGMLYYYGVISKFEAFRYLNELMGPIEQVLHFFQAIEFGSAYYEIIEDVGNHYSFLTADETEAVLNDQASRRSLEYRPFTKHQLMQAGKEDYVEKTAAFYALHAYLKQNYGLVGKELDFVMMDIMESAQKDEPLGQTMAILQDMIEFETVEELHGLMDLIVKLNNSTPKWVLKGHSPNEVSSSAPPISRPSNVIPLQPKLGRNELCHCGSGKKYKKCCGKS